MKPAFGYGGVASEITLLYLIVSNPTGKNPSGTVRGRQFKWGASLPKSNGGVPRSTRREWKPCR